MPFGFPSGSIIYQGNPSIFQKGCLVDRSKWIAGPAAPGLPPRLPPHRRPRLWALRGERLVLRGRSGSEGVAEANQRHCHRTGTNSIAILKSLRDPPTPVDSPPLTNCRVPQVWGQEKDVFLPRSFFMSQMLRMLEMQGMQPHNLQEQTQSSPSRF